MLVISFYLYFFTVNEWTQWSTCEGNCKYGTRRRTNTNSNEVAMEYCIMPACGSSQRGMKPTSELVLYSVLNYEWIFSPIKPLQSSEWQDVPLDLLPLLPSLQLLSKMRWPSPLELPEMSSVPSLAERPGPVLTTLTCATPLLWMQGFVNWDLLHQTGLFKMWIRRQQLGRYSLRSSCNACHKNLKHWNVSFF